MAHDDTKAALERLFVIQAKARFILSELEPLQDDPTIHDEIDVIYSLRSIMEHLEDHLIEYQRVYGDEKLIQLQRISTAIVALSSSAHQSFHKLQHGKELAYDIMDFCNIPAGEQLHPPHPSSPYTQAHSAASSSRQPPSVSSSAHTQDMYGLVPVGQAMGAMAYSMDSSLPDMPLSIPQQMGLEDDRASRGSSHRTQPRSVNTTKSWYVTDSPANSMKQRGLVPPSPGMVSILDSNEHLYEKRSPFPDPPKNKFLAVVRGVCNVAAVTVLVVVFGTAVNEALDKSVKPESPRVRRTALRYAKG